MRALVWSACVLGLGLCGHVSTVQGATKPLHRTLQQQATGGVVRQAEAAANLAGYGPSLAFLQNLMKEGHADPISVLGMGLNSPGYKTLLTNTEIQRRLIEELPLLRAFKPFKDLADKGKAATGAETSAGFAEGMKASFDFMKDAIVKIKDPNVMADTLTKLSVSGDKNTQEVFKRARTGDVKAVEELQVLFAKEQFPGVDFNVLKEVAADHSFKKLLDMDEVMRYLDRDASLSAVFRNPMSFTAPAST